jgi:hypothetical protein
MPKTRDDPMPPPRQLQLAGPLHAMGLDFV